MEVLHLPDNIKVHFAGCEVQNQYIAAQLMGVRYTLYTAFPFVERKVLKTAKSPIMPLKGMENPSVDIPKYIYQHSKHVIQDSGLFTLMFGSMAGKKDESMVNRWYDGLVEFTLEHGLDVTCVEVDCQKILGVEKAWEFRQRMRNDLPNNRIINVFHLEDGQYGLDRMIEYSDYIAISVPELRRNQRRGYVNHLAKYIKGKKPSIDIHLLGCTELDAIRMNNFCTSCDSTSWVAGKRFGFVEGRHISRIKKDEVINLCGKDVYDKVNVYNKEQNVNFLLLQIENLKRKYQNAAGNQDYKREPI